MALVLLEELVLCTVVRQRFPGVDRIIKPLLMTNLERLLVYHTVWLIIPLLNIYALFFLMSLKAIEFNKEKII